MRRRIRLGRYNLLHEPWLRVMIDDKGTVNEVSIHELFEHSHEYKQFAGETRTQNFVILRLLLAILHTVFSRLNAEGKPYGYIELDEKYRQLEPVDEDDHHEYSQDLMDTWTDLWFKKAFPTIINKYLAKWEDRFNLFDEEYPFFQVSKKELDSRELSASKPTKVSAKTFNRTISESGNKTALFSPRYEENKDFTTSSELARWLVTYQGYSGTGDKAIFGQGGKTSRDKYKVSKGWVYDLGGINLEGANLFETLMLNLALIHPDSSYENNPQNPSWENSDGEVLTKMLASKPITSIDNLAELYSNWSRAVYIDPESNLSNPFSFGVVKLPEIEHQNHFLEIMTLWGFNKQGINKDHFTPRKHASNAALWRSFGIVALPSHDNHRRPGVIDWLSQIYEVDGNIQVIIRATSMKDDGNATSWVPTDEITDYLNINEHILSEVSEGGWVPRINDEVELIKRVIGQTLRMFASDISNLRNNPGNGFIDNVLQDAYFAVDLPFREWLRNLKPEDGKDRQVTEWRNTLNKIILEQAQQVTKSAGKRDFMGKEENGKLVNIAVVYNRFLHRLNTQLKGG